MVHMAEVHTGAHAWGALNACCETVSVLWCPQGFQISATVMLQIVQILPARIP